MRQHNFLQLICHAHTFLSNQPTLWSVSILGDFFGIMITCPLGSFSAYYYSTLGTFYVPFLTCPQLDKLAGYLRNLLQEASPIYQFRWTLSVVTIIKRNISRNTRHEKPSLLLDPFGGSSLRLRKICLMALYLTAHCLKFRLSKAKMTKYIK